MSCLRVGILGFGRIGAEHAGWIASSGGCEVSAVFDPTPARAEIARGRGLPVVGNLDALFDACDAVLVATPTSFHREHALAALAAGRHVMDEKPLALDLAGSREVVESAERVGRVLSVFHCRRWDADFLAVRELVASGRLGRVFNVESRLGQFASCVGPAAREWRPEWRNEAAFGGGGLYDWGSHFLDQLLLLLAPARPVRVFAQLRGNVWTHDCDDLARVLIDFSDGTAAVCEINTTTTRPLPRWHLDGTAGSASSPPSPGFSTAEWARLTVTKATGETAPFTHLPGEGRLTEAQIWAAFAGACRGEGPPAVEAGSVLPTMAVIDAALLSAREGRAVALG